MTSKKKSEEQKQSQNIFEKVVATGQFP